MKKVLGNKKPDREGENELWLEVYGNWQNYVSVDELEELSENAVARLRAAASLFSKIGYAWSGGKDSLVMLDLVRRSGIDLVGGIFFEFENEYPSFLEWLKVNMPQDCETRHIASFSLEYLDAHPEYLFPVDPKCRQAYDQPKWKPQQEFATEHGLDCMLFGRRTIDGNVCGREGKRYVDGICRYSFIYDWPQEAILGYLRMHEIELPPFYFYANGFTRGTYPWTARKRVNDSYMDTFREIYDEIDKRIVLEAAPRLSLARKFLESL